MRDAGVEHPVKINLIPKGKNKLHIRLINTMDKFDKDNETDFISEHTKSVNVIALVKSLWHQANGDISYSNLIMKELTLGSNLSLREAQERKVKWQVRDGDIGYTSSEFNPEKLVLIP